MNKFLLLALSLSVFFLASCASSPVQPTAKAPAQPAAKAAAPPAASPAVKQAVNMTGTWNLELVTSGGTGNPVFTLKQDGNKLSGTYKGRFGEAPCSGTVNGNDFVITYELSGSKVIYKGKVDGDKMSGEADLAGQASGKFTGMKAK